MATVGSSARRSGATASASGKGRKRKAVPWSSVADYRFRFSVERFLAPTGEPDEYILTIDGAILWEPEDAASPVIVGETKAVVIQAGRACNDSVSLCDVCDCHSQEALDAYTLLYDEETLKEAVSEGGWHDALILSRALVLPEHRGNRLGQLALLRQIEDFGNQVGVAACKPFPLQHEAHREGREDPYKLADFARDGDHGMKRLRRYWGELGFEQIGTSDWFSMDLAYERPTFGDFVSQR